MKSTQTSATKKIPSVARKKRREIRLKKTTLVFAVAVALAGLTVYGLYRPEVSISSVDVTGANVIKPENIGEFVKNEISGKYLYIFPKKSIFIYPKDKIVAGLRNNFKRIENVNVERKGFTKIAVNLSERPEHYLWCGRDFLDSRKPSDQCYFIDSLGYVFSKAPFYSGNLFFEFYGPLATGENASPIGGTVIAENDFEKIIYFKNFLEELGLPSGKVFVKPDGDYEFYLNEAGKISVSGKNDLAKSAGYLSTALSADPLKSKFEQGSASLEYLDVRFGNKVYYKFK